MLIENVASGLSNALAFVAPTPGRQHQRKNDRRGDSKHASNAFYFFAYAGKQEMAMGPQYISWFCLRSVLRNKP